MKKSDNENTQIVISSFPDGKLKESNFSVQTTTMPKLSPGSVLCRTMAVTIGAGLRAGLQGSANYTGATSIGDVMAGSGIAVVEASNSQDFMVGERVRASTGWQRYSIQKPENLIKVDASADPSLLLGSLGTNGLTAYFGLMDIGQVTKNDTVLVSAAAGSVGHMVCQMAKAIGARVIGVTGSDKKCAKLVDELGLDAAINRRSDNFRAEFKSATQDRVDLYFDNTGGKILQSALFRMAVGGRIVCCGAASQYDTASPEPGPRGIPGLLVNNRVKMQGFLIFDYAEKFDEARFAINQWIENGDINPKVTNYGNLEEAPRAFIELLNGNTYGTTIVSVD